MGKPPIYPFVILSEVDGPAVTLSQPQSGGKATNLPFVIPSAGICGIQARAHFTKPSPMLATTPRYLAVHPPSMRMSVPVMNPANSEQR
jgi:hypothetical protein